MKRYIILCLVALCAASSFAVPAFRGLRSVRQPDGTTLMVQLVGDEYFHYIATADGLPLVQNQASAYVYARMQGGKFVATDMVAHEPALRQAQEMDVIATLQPVVMPESAKQRMMQDEQRRADRAQARRVSAAQHAGATSGNKRGLIILVNYSDTKMQHTQAEFDAMMNEQNYSKNGCIGSLSDYFNDQSYGQLKIDFDVVGPFTASKSIKYYGENDEYGSDLHPAELVSEAVKLADAAGVDFSRYDWNGNRKVDQVFVIYAGYAESYYAPDYTIWPHEWDLTSAKYYGDGPGPILVDGVTVNTYACAAELNGNSGTKMTGIGTPAHEFSHCLGLPDFYDTDGGSGAGMCAWSLMDYGSYNADTYVPCAYTSYERMYCGWLTPTELTVGASVRNMRPISEAPEAYIVYNEGNRNEYYMLENHQQTHDSESYHAWDVRGGGHGMLVVHVDYDAASWTNNTVNNDVSHQRMTIVPANNRHTANYSAAIAAGNTFPGTSNKTALTDKTTPAATLYNANRDGRKFLNAPIENISEANGGISFIFRGGAIIDPPAALEAEEVDTTSFIARWEEVENALSYTLELTDLLDNSSTDPQVTTYFKEDFTTKEPFASTASETSKDICSELDKYFAQSGWTGSKLYVSAKALKLGASKNAGSLVSPVFDAPENGELTVEVGVSKYGTDTGRLVVSVLDANGTLICKEELTPDGERHVMNFKDIDKKFKLSFVTTTKRANIFYLSATNTQEAPPSDKVRTYGPIMATHCYLPGLRPAGLYSYRVKVKTMDGTSDWGEPMTVQLLDPVSIDRVLDDAYGESVIYNLQGQRLEKLQRGINIVGGKKVLCEAPADCPQRPSPPAELPAKG